MATNTDPNAFEVKPGDVRITDAGGVEIVNLRLSEAIRTSLEAEARLPPRLKNTDTNYVLCGANIPCSSPK
jgi:hypothetical protein